MEKMKHVGTFHSVETVLYKITELEAQGYPKKEIYAVSNVQDHFEMLRTDAEVNLLDVESRNLLDHTRELFHGKDRMLQVFNEMGFSEQQAKSYYEELKEGGVALFIEERWKGPTNETLMDSRVERGIGGEPLDGQPEEGKVYLNEDTVPRIDTTNL